MQRRQHAIQGGAWQHLLFFGEVLYLNSEQKRSCSSVKAWNQRPAIFFEATQ
jgi:hypothetical protein